MDWDLVAEAGRIVSGLSPGKRETVREIAIDASHRGVLTERSRQVLDRMTGSALVAEIVSAAAEEAGAAPSTAARRPVNGRSGDCAATAIGSGDLPDPAALQIGR